jgi:hypothetical protein
VDGFALQDHLPVAEVTNEIEIAALVIDPGLLPVAGARIKS